MTIFKTMVVTSLRDKITLFYSILLPIGLLVGLGNYFNNDEYIPVLLTGVLALSSLFWGVSGIAFQVYWQRSRGVFKFLKMTPYPIISFIFIMAAARAVLGIAINLLVLAIGILLFDVTVSIGSLFIMTAIIAIGTLCFTCMGILIANFANNEGQISMISNLFYFPMVFGAETFYSLENAPAWVVTMGEMFPLGYYVNGLRAALGSSEQAITPFVLILVIYTMVLLIATALTFKYDTTSKLWTIQRKKKQSGIA